jgi:uncharacterized membrane protein (DUF4010 family)
VSVDGIPALERLAVALLVGFLIGLERERAEARKARALFAGVRTFPLIALAGAAPMLVAGVAGTALLVTSFVAVAAVAIVSYVRTSRRGAVGATTEIAAVATFLLGALAGAGGFVVAGAAGVTVAVLLAAKPRLEAFSRALTSEEVTAVLELAVISVIVLPILPDRGFGPWEVLNPRQIWIVVVLVSALSFAGFVLNRLLGEGRGLLATGALGGLVSSTAVTMAMAARSHGDERLARPAAGAAAIASTIMCVRIGVLAGAADVSVLPLLLPVLAAMGVTGAAGAWFLGRSGNVEPEVKTDKVANPFSLRAALGFAAVYAAVLLIVRGGQQLFGESGLLVAAALAGFADVDAPTIAFTRFGSTGGSWQVAAAAITVAAVSNTLVKLGLAVGLGAGRFRWLTATVLGVMGALGAAVGIIVYTR